jgi:hypothetical protein
MASLRVDFRQLKTAVDWSITQLQAPRANRLEAVRQFAGRHYARHGSEKRVPTNFLELATTIYIRLLAANAPATRVTTTIKSLKPYAKTTELALNQIPEEIDLGSTLRRAVLEAMFSIGIVKVGIAASGVAVLGHDVGEAYVDIVPIDDYFLDMSAKTRKSIQFEGNDYWMMLDTARKMFNTNDIELDQHTITGDQGDQRAESVSTEEGADLYKDKVWLRDVYLHDTGQLVTYQIQSGKNPWVKNWDGPENGPYHTLGFSDVPGNILPLPPVALWTDLHELGNAVFRKLANQADSKKTVAAFPGGADEAVNNLKGAADGDGITFPSAQKPENITVGGIDQPTLAFYLQVQDLFDYFAGNLNTLGGLGPGSETVGQDRLMTEAAGARAQDMSQQTIKFAKGIFKALAWYEWTDPVRKRIIEKRIGDTDIYLRREWSDETREGNFLDYNFDIDVYSMQDNSSSVQLQKLNMVVERYVVPLMPLIEQQGGTFDVKFLLEQVAELSNLPAVAELVKFQGEPPVVQGGPQGNPSPSFKPAQTHRTYERINRPGATRRGRNSAMSQLLMGGNVQKAEKEAIGRRVG